MITKELAHQIITELTQLIPGIPIANDINLPAFFGYASEDDEFQFGFEFDGEEYKAYTWGYDEGELEDGNSWVGKFMALCNDKYKIALDCF